MNERTRIELESGDAVAATVLTNADGQRVYVSAFDIDHDTVATLELTPDEAGDVGQLLQDAADEARRGPPTES